MTQIPPILSEVEFPNSLEPFFQRLKQIIPEQNLDDTIRSFYTDKAVTFRINSSLASGQDLNEIFKKYGFHAQAINDFPGCYEIPFSQKSKLTHSEFFEKGHCYIQNLSSMLPALILNPTKTDRVLDIAAAPGSKTTLLANLMENQGWISAVEINKPRFHKLLNNLKQQNILNTHTYLMDGGNVWKKCPEQFDKILVDAPCSSESRFNLNDPKTYSHWSERKVKEMQKKQLRLLFSAILSCKVSGEIVYSTCSFSVEENEWVINKMLKKFSNKLTILDININVKNTQAGLKTWKSKKFDPQLEKCMRILPTERMEGFFICKLKKTESTNRKKNEFTLS